MLFRLAKRSSVQQIVNLSTYTSNRISRQRQFCCIFTQTQQRCNNLLEPVPDKLTCNNSILPLTTTTIIRAYSTEHNEQPPEANPGIVKKFKQMFKDYWYVLLPVHVATSVVWLGGFYLALKSGVDIVGLLERLGTSERILDYLRHSEAGYIALSYACYKIATPARYAVTVGGTTLGTEQCQHSEYSWSFAFFSYFKVEGHWLFEINLRSGKSTQGIEKGYERNQRQDKRRSGE